LFFVADPKRGFVVTRTAIDLTEKAVVELGLGFKSLLAGGGPHPPLTLLVGERAEILARQAELRACYRQMGWGK
jgi:hypothetical protein